MKKLFQPQAGFRLQFAPMALSSSSSMFGASSDPFVFFAGEDKETIEVSRRRQGSSSGPSGRADAPSRRETGSGGPGWSGGSGSSGGGGLGRTGGGGLKLPIWLILVLIACFVLYMVFFSGGEDGSQQDPGISGNTQVAEAQDEPFVQPTQAPARPTRTPAPRNTSAPSAGSKGDTWTVLMYLDADDEVLEQDIYFDLNEMERVGSTDKVNIIAQVDRNRGAFRGDGNWTGTRRYYVKQDNDLSTVNSDMVDDLGEVNMADGQTLVDFATWGIQNYPADKYMLVLSDHGMGWPGGWSDPDPASQDNGRSPIQSNLDGDYLYLSELNQALSDIRSQTGMDKFELVGMDACLMGHLEVFSMLEPHARYAVASQETEPALGWAYAGFLGQLVENPAMDGAELGSDIVSSYIKEDTRIVDDEARADYMRGGSSFGGLFGSSSAGSAQQLANQLGQDVTLTAADLSMIPTINQDLNNFAVALQDEDQSIVATARDYSQSFTNVFGQSKRSAYLDLGNFIKVLQKQGISSKASRLGDQVLADIGSLAASEIHGRGKPGAEGVSIYFPNSTMYRSPISGPQSYTAVAKTFAVESLWDDFLAFHYNDVRIRPENREPMIPDLGAPSRAPGLGTITVSPMTASSRVAAPNSPVTLTADVKGKNIGYIYLFTGFYDQNANSIYVADTDYLDSSEIREANGIYYPQWPVDKTFTLKLNWEPTVFAVDDGSTSAVALFNPQVYGASAQEAVYAVDGIYTPADGTQISARLFFQNGELRKVYGFQGDAQQAGSPWEITPQEGDTFTILEQWMDMGDNGQVKEYATQQGKTLKFGKQTWQMKEMYAAKGEYVVGFIIEDLDGNRQAVYAQVTVR